MTATARRTATATARRGRRRRPDAEAEGGGGDPRPVGGSGLGTPAGAVTEGAGRPFAGEARWCADGDAAALLEATPVAPAGTPPPSARVETWVRCGLPAVRSTTIPPAATAATAITAVTERGCRRIRRHHSGPGTPIAFGKPVGPNDPARCATLARSARPAGVLSVQALSTCPRSSSGSSIAAGAPSPGAGSETFAGGDVTPAAGAQAFIARYRVKPGAQPVRIA